MQPKPAMEKPWALLSRVPALEEFYLAGSGALELRLDHRSSHGLDFMSASYTLRSAQRRDLLTHLLELDPRVRVETARDGLLFIRFPDGLAVRLHFYPYPLVATVDVVGGLRVASLEDVGLMKLGAIISRRSRRDFVDLFYITRYLSLEKLLEYSKTKFAHVRDFPLQALKALADHHLSENDAMPQLHQPESWATIAHFCATEARRLARHKFGLEPSEVSRR